MKALPEMKRVVTGHDVNGQSVVSMAGKPPNAFSLQSVPGTVFHEIWNTDDTPAVIDSSADPTDRPLVLSPGERGSVVRVVDIPPDSVHESISDEAAAETFAEMGESHAGTSNSSSRHKLMHRTQTVDYGIVIEGEVWLVLDEGEERLKPGDVVVQRGTNHAWSNRTESMARMMFVLIDGRFSSERESEQ